MKTFAKWWLISVGALFALAAFVALPYMVGGWAGVATVLGALAFIGTTVWALNEVDT